MILSQKQIEDDELLKLFNDIVWPLKMPPLPNTRELMLRFAKNCYDLGEHDGYEVGYSDGWGKM